MVDVQATSTKLMWDVEMDIGKQRDIKRPKSLELFASTYARSERPTSLAVFELHNHLCSNGKFIRENKRPLTWGPILSHDLLVSWPNERLLSVPSTDLVRTSSEHHELKAQEENHAKENLNLGLAEDFQNSMGVTTEQIDPPSCPIGNGYHNLSVTTGGRLVERSVTVKNESVPQAMKPASDEHPLHEHVKSCTDFERLKFKETLCHEDPNFITVNNDLAQDDAKAVQKNVEINDKPSCSGAECKSGSPSQKLENILLPNTCQDKIESYKIAPHSEVATDLNTKKQCTLHPTAPTPTVKCIAVQSRTLPVGVTGYKANNKKNESTFISQDIYACVDYMINTVERRNAVENNLLERSCSEKVGIVPDLTFASSQQLMNCPPTSTGLEDDITETNDLSCSAQHGRSFLALVDKGKFDIDSNGNIIEGPEINYGEDKAETTDSEVIAEFLTPEKAAETELDHPFVFDKNDELGHSHLRIKARPDSADDTSHSDNMNDKGDAAPAEAITPFVSIEKHHKAVEIDTDNTDVNVEMETFVVLPIHKSYKGTNHSGVPEPSSSRSSDDHEVTNPNSEWLAATEYSPNLLREGYHDDHCQSNSPYEEPRTNENQVIAKSSDDVATSIQLVLPRVAVPNTHCMLMTHSADDDCDDGDIFSEEIDEVLERPTMRRQDSFGEHKLLYTASLTAVEFDMDLIAGEFMPTSFVNPSGFTGNEPAWNTDGTVDVANEGKTSKKRLPVPSHEPNNLPSISSMGVYRYANKRDSALSRESALSTASSDTMIASEDDFIESRIDSCSSSCGDTQNYMDSENRKILKNERKFSHKKIESPLVTSERKSEKTSKRTDQNGINALNIGHKKTMTLAEYDANVKSSGGSKEDMSSSLNFIEMKRAQSVQDSSSIHSSTTSISSRQSSTDAKEAASSNCSSRCSSSPTSPMSSPLLRHQSMHSRSVSVDYKERRDIPAEREAAEALKWLRCAGFPQYASLFEAGQFPINISEVEKDHDFLEEVHFEALCRRLDILNKCAVMEFDGIRPEIQTDEEVDVDDEECAISKNWHYEENRHRWSRLNECLETRIPSAQGLDRLEESLPPLTSSLAYAKDEDMRPITLIPAGTNESSKKISSKHVNQSQSDQGSSMNKLKKKNFLKRELKRIRSSSFRRKDKTNVESANAHGRKGNRFKAYVIGEPTLQSGHEKLEKFHCTPIVDSNKLGSPLQHASHNSEGTRRRKGSSHSITSTSSSSIGGNSSAASTPSTLAKNTRLDESKGRFNGIEDLPSELSPVAIYNEQYLEQVDPTEPTHQKRSQDAKVFFVPRTHTAGTFPSTLESSGTSCSNYEVPLSPSKSSRQNIEISMVDSSGFKRPVSIYDNIAKSDLNPAASAQDLLDMLDLDSSYDQGVLCTDMHDSSPESYWNVDDIVQKAERLKQQIKYWGLKDEQKFPGEYEQDIDSTDSMANSNSDLSQGKVDAFEEEMPYNLMNGRLTDEEFRYYKTLAYNYPSPPEKQNRTGAQNLQLDNLSAGQLMILRRLSVLKLTALMEKYMTASGTGTSKATNFNWYIPRFIRRNKITDGKGKSVFGAPLLHNVQRLCQPIPKCIVHAMNYLLSTSLDQIGLFRKPGVKSRIQKLRETCEANPRMQYFENWNAYDVADMVKQYFRDLPEPLMTAKLSDTFTGIFLYVPSELRRETLCAALMMLPDENSEALRTLIWFLKNVALSAAENQMNESNLAVCFAPSLFYQGHQNANHNSSTKQMQVSTPSRVRKLSKHGAMALGKPNIKDMNNNKASSRCLTYLIKEFNNIFKIPEDAMTQCRLSVMQQNHDVLRTELGYAAHEGLGRSPQEKTQEILSDFHMYVDRVTAQAVREETRSSHGKSWGWTQIPSLQGTELSYKKVNDGNYLRIWKCRVEIEGVNPEQIMRRILSERHVWDEKLIQSKLLEIPDERTECLHIERSQLTPSLHRDYCVLRSWRTNQSSRDITVIVEVSTDHPKAVVQNSIRGVVLTSRYVIEPMSLSVWASDSTSSTSSTGSNGSGQKCYVTHVSRVDTKGRNPEWYNKAYGHIALQLMQQMRESFRS